MSNLTSKIYGFTLSHHDVGEIEELLIENMDNPVAFVVCVLSIGHLAMRFGCISDALEEKLQQLWPHMKGLPGALEGVEAMQDDLDQFLSKQIILS